MVSDPVPLVRAPLRQPLSLLQSRLWLLIAAMAAAAAALQSFAIPLDCDVSWLITVSEKLLAGGRLYVDVIEPNPPASVWLYVPQVWIAERLGLHAEAVVVAAFIAAAVLSLGTRCGLPPTLANRRSDALAGQSACHDDLPLADRPARAAALLLHSGPGRAALVADGRRWAWAALASGVAAGLFACSSPLRALILPVRICRMAGRRCVR